MPAPTGGDCGYNGGAACGQQDYGISNYFDQNLRRPHWFGGVYYLFMDRTNPFEYTLGHGLRYVGPAYPYYPGRRTEPFCETHDADDGFRSGGEIRFGSTFGIGSACDTCNTGCGGYGLRRCNSGCGCNACENQDYAWEAALLGISTKT